MTRITWDTTTDWEDFQDASGIEINDGSTSLTEGHFTDYKIHNETDATLSSTGSWETMFQTSYESEGGPLLLDYHASTDGGNHNDVEKRLLVNGEQSTLIRQTDSDEDNPKMWNLFDILELSPGSHTIEMQWKGHDTPGPWQDNYDQDDNNTTWTINGEAPLKIIELNETLVNYDMVEKTDESTDGSSWSTIMSTNYTVQEDSFIIFRSFISAHAIPTTGDGGYEARLVVDGEQRNLARTWESNDGYCIVGVLGADEYKAGDTIEVIVEWAEISGDTYELDGTNARLSIMEFAMPVNTREERGYSSTPPSSWDTIYSINMTAELDTEVYHIAQASFDADNDYETRMRTLLNDNQVTWQETSVSDDDAYDVLMTSSVDAVSASDYNISQEWETDSASGGVDSALVIMAVESVDEGYIITGKKSL